MYKRKMRNKKFEAFLLCLLPGYVFVISSSVFDLSLCPLTNFWTFGGIGKIDLAHLRQYVGSSLDT